MVQRSKFRKNNFKNQQLLRKLKNKFKYTFVKTKNTISKGIFIKKEKFNEKLFYALN